MASELLMPERFAVAGVVVERLALSHLAGLCRLDSDPVVMTSLGGLRGPEITAEHPGYDLERWEQRGVGMYALVAGSAAVIGRAGRRSTVMVGRRELEVAYSLLPEFWGKGLATAVVCRLVELAQSGGVSDSLVATVTAKNPASVRVREKAACEFEAEIEREGEVMVLYRRALK